ncbi:PH domain-containing protein [Candidatus Saccharibacteria bacterium]|nr:PH domain-containing protein [Candidatus Saccharibacteria bacterium]
MAKLSFSGQHADETLLFVFRRHIIAMRKGFYGLLIPFAIGSIPFLIWQDNVALLWLPLIGFGVGVILFLYQFMGWYFSVFIVTDQRIRQLTQNSIFGHSVIDVDLAKIQNISYNISGFWSDILGYGTIVLQTIVGDMVINKVARPVETYNKLSEAIHAAGGNVDQDPDQLSDQNAKKNQIKFDDKGSIQEEDDNATK